MFFLGEQMKTLAKFLSLGLLTLTLAFAFTSCSKNDDNAADAPADEAVLEFDEEVTAE